MPVTVVLPNQPKPYPDFKAEKSDIDFLARNFPTVAPPDSVVYEGTWKGIEEQDGVAGTADSLVRGVFEAWAKHLHLVLRPDEVWMAILAQMNFYMKENAEKVRHLFVSHQGKEAIEIHGNTFMEILPQFGAEIQKKIKTPWVRDWVTPNFTTTTDNDRLTANMMMMGLMQHYFQYSMGIICGLPSVTLLGEREDWEKLNSKLERLDFFGEQPAAYHLKLKPIMRGFIETFIHPDSKQVQDFWGGAVLAEPDNLCGAPDVRIDGWILDFCHWTSGGHMLHYRPDIWSIPSGLVTVPVTLVTSNPPEELLIAAGNIAKKILPGAPIAYYEALKRPIPGDDGSPPVYGDNDRLADAGDTSSPPYDRGAVQDAESRLPVWLQRLRSLACVSLPNPFSPSQSAPHERQTSLASGPGPKEVDPEPSKRQGAAPQVQAESSDAATTTDSKTEKKGIWTRPGKASGAPSTDPLQPLHASWTVDLVQLEGGPGLEHATLQPMSGWMLFCPQWGENSPTSSDHSLSAINDGDWELRELESLLAQELRALPKMRPFKRGNR